MWRHLELTRINHPPKLTPRTLSPSVEPVGGPPGGVYHDESADTCREASKRAERSNDEGRGDHIVAKGWSRVGDQWPVEWAVVHTVGRGVGEGADECPSLLSIE